MNAISESGKIAVAIIGARANFSGYGEGLDCVSHLSLALGLSGTLGRCSCPARLQLAVALGREFNCGPGPRLCNQLRMRLKPSLCTDGDLASSEVREPQTLRSDLETGSLALQFDHVGRACTLRRRR